MVCFLLDSLPMFYNQCGYLEIGTGRYTILSRISIMNTDDKLIEVNIQYRDNRESR